MKSLGIIILVLSLIMLVWMRGWINYEVPLTPREENVSQLTDLWNLTKAAKMGHLWTAWNPLRNTGAPNRIQRSYVVFAPLAQLSASTGISPDTMYKSTAYLAFVASGLGMFLFLRTIRLNSWAALVGGIAYMVSPPHLTLASDLLDFNMYLATIPWLLWIVERFLQHGSALFHGSLAGILLTFGLFAGNTYFVTSLPFFALYSAIRLLPNYTSLASRLRFCGYTIGFFIALSAFVIIPSTIEFSHTWLSQEIQRKQIIDLPQVTDLIKLFTLRWQGYSALSWHMNTRYPDMSWYFGTVVLGLSMVAIIKNRHYRPWLIPTVAIPMGIIPFFIAVRYPLAKHIALQILVHFPSLQSTLDRTYRLFILPSFFMSVLAAIGAHELIKVFPRHVHFPGTLIVMALIVDFFPLSAYFYATPHQDISLSQATVEKINSSTGRFWFVFPYLRPVPKYKYEYVTRQLYVPRINSEYSYNALAPRYSAELFEKKLFGALETHTLSFDQINNLIKTANTTIVIFPHTGFDYSPAVEWFTQKGWSLMTKTPQFWVISHQASEFVIATPHNSQTQIAWQRPHPEVIKINLHQTQASNVAAAESWYPGWRVQVDHTENSLLRSNYAFIGVHVPAGEHEVIFRYIQPWYYPVSLIISLTSLVLVIGVSAHHCFLSAPQYSHQVQK